MFTRYMIQSLTGASMMFMRNMLRYRLPERLWMPKVRL